MAKGLWTTAEGQVLKIANMGDEHLLNSLRMLRRKHAAAVADLFGAFNKAEAGPEAERLRKEALRLGEKETEDLYPVYALLRREAGKRRLDVVGFLGGEPKPKKQALVTDDYGPQLDALLEADAEKRLKQAKDSLLARMRQKEGELLVDLSSYKMSPAEAAITAAQYMAQGPDPFGLRSRSESEMKMNQQARAKLEAKRREAEEAYEINRRAAKAERERRAKERDRQWLEREQSQQRRKEAEAAKAESRKAAEAANAEDYEAKLTAVGKRKITR